MRRLIQVLDLLGPHELVALVLFLGTVAVWAVTLEALYR
jgi:hypothetical protein